MEEKPMDMLDFNYYCRDKLNNFALTQFISKLKNEKFEVVVRDYKNASLYELISDNMKLVVMGSVIIKMVIQGREISSEIISAMRKAGSNSIIREIIDDYYKEKKWKEEAERKKKILDDINFITNFCSLGETKNVQTNNKD